MGRLLARSQMVTVTVALIGQVKTGTSRIDNFRVRTLHQDYDRQKLHKTVNQLLDAGKRIVSFLKNWPETR